MWSQFILENLHFALNIFASLVMFAVFWLYLDAWKTRHSTPTAFAASGFLSLAISFLIHAGSLETSVLAQSFISTSLEQILLPLTRLIGYFCLIAAQFTEPLQPKPTYNLVLPPLLLISPPLLYPILAVATGFLYLRRGTIGLENHLKPVALSFYLLGFSEMLTLASYMRITTSTRLLGWVNSFGPIWLLEHLLLLAGLIILCRWVFGYLFKQLHTQLFMIYTISIVVIFLATTVTFTGLLINNIHVEAEKQLETDVKVLAYALENKTAQAISDTHILSLNPQVVTLLTQNTQESKRQLFELAQSTLLGRNGSTVTIVDSAGTVITRGEEKERTGDTLTGDSLIKRALLGENISSVLTKEGVLAPEITIAAAAPIKSGSQIIGAVRFGTIVDSAFVDGIKKSTGLESGMYADNTISATTLTTPDGRGRLIGLKEEHQTIKTRVLKEGASYIGSVEIRNTPYLAAYLPILDMDNTPVGMFFAGRPEITVLQTAATSIQYTFLTTIILLIMSVIPTYFIAKFIADQVQ